MRRSVECLECTNSAVSQRKLGFSALKENLHNKDTRHLLAEVIRSDSLALGVDYV